MPLVKSKKKTTNRKPRKKKSRRMLKDPESTGRKEAARLYPRDPERDCEWSWDRVATLAGEEDRETDKGSLALFLTEISGSVKLIAPCEKGKEQHIHHGPDKNPTNNEPGNVHRICTSHHNLWHYLNDDDYAGEARSD